MANFSSFGFGKVGAPDWTNKFPGSLNHNKNKDSINNLGNTFEMFMNNMQTQMDKPYKLAGEMVTGAKPFDPTELIMTVVENERKVSLAIRVLNDTIRGVKQLEQIQA